MDSRSYAQEWFELAKSDIEAAQFLLKMRPKPNEIIAYHCQQAAEKYMKGFLVLHGQKPPRTHDLAALNEKCSTIDSRFAEMYEACLELTEYAVDVRYPGHIELQDRDVDQALIHSKRICSLVERLTSS